MGTFIITRATKKNIIFLKTIFINILCFGNTVLKNQVGTKQFLDEKITHSSLLHYTINAF